MRRWYAGFALTVSFNLVDKVLYELDVRDEVADGETESWDCHIALDEGS